MNRADQNILSSVSLGGAEDRSIVTESVSKTFMIRKGEPVVALSDVSLRINDGEFVSIVGPSGCGKSTMLRILAGLESPTSGIVRVGDDSPEAVTRRHEIGVAFQDHALLPWLTVAENIMLPARLAGLTPDLEQVTRLVELVGLQDFHSARPKQLSGGMRQRVSIARAMMLEPKFLLFDEPFGALDLVTRRLLNLEMQRIWASMGTTTLLITHSVDEAVQLSDRVLVMTARPGRILDIIEIDLPRPRNRDVLNSPEFGEYVRRAALALDEASLAGQSEDDT